MTTGVVVKVGKVYPECSKQSLHVLQMMWLTINLIYVHATLQASA